jgi:hypothetical protein
MVSCLIRSISDLTLVFKSSKPNNQTTETEAETELAPASASDSNYETARREVAADNTVRVGVDLAGGRGGGPVQGSQPTLGKKDTFWILW